MVNLILQRERLKYNLLYRIEQIYVLLFFISFTSFGQQYVHPNQAGRKGGDTNPGIGAQVVTSTYYGNAGSLYGQGVIMAVNKDGTNAASFHDFDGYGGGDGSYPFYTTPHQGSDGKLYGTTFIGGTSNMGAIYQYNFANCSESLIYNAGPLDTTITYNSANYANINELSDGKIYYLNTYGGLNGYGALFKMNKDGSSVQLIHNFTYATAQVSYTTAANAQLSGGALKYDGAYPYGFVVEGADGKIYGSTYAGGAYNQGTWWRCNKDGSNYEIIRAGYLAYSSFSNGTGGSVSAYGIGYSWGNVAQDANGKIYITGYYGGALNLGAVARMDPDGSNFQLLLSGSASNGTYPYRGALVIDNRVYGTFRTNGGGTAIGVVYSMNLDGSDYQKLKTFDSPYGDGSDPWAGLSYDGSFLFGTTLSNGGSGAVGTIFKIRPDGTGFQKIHTFNNTQNAISTACSGTGKTGFYAYYPSSERVTFADVTFACSKTCLSNPSSYSGQSGTPTLSGTILSNKCPSATADLNSLLGSMATNVTWHTAVPATEANRVSYPTSATSGTYYAVYYDSVNDLYSSSATNPVTVTTNTCVNTISLNGSSVNLTTSINTSIINNVATNFTPNGVSPFSYTPVDCSTGIATTSSKNLGSVSLNSTTGLFTYIPATGFTGVDTFCVKICDGNTSPNCKTVTYNIYVAPQKCDATGTTPQN